MKDMHFYHNHQPNPLDIKQLAEFDVTIANLTQSEQRRRRVIYLRDAAEKIKVGKSFLKGFGWLMIPLAIIPILWPFFAFLWFFRKKAGSMMEIQFKNALDYWGIHESLIDDYLSEDTFD
jgi:hypothetical protein